MASKNIIQACDITESKKVEEALQKSQITLEKAQELGHMGSWDWDIVTNDVIWSDEVYRIYGMDAKKIRPKYKTVLNSLAPESKGVFLKAIDDVLKHGKPFDLEYSIFRPNGTKKYLHTKGEMVRDKNGSPIRMFGIVQDITRRKNMEKVALELKERDEAILSSIVDAVFAIDKNGMIMLFNKMAERLTGVLEKNAIGNHFKQVVSFIKESDGKPNYDFIDEANVKNQKVKMVNHGILIGKNGARIPIAYGASPIRTAADDVIGAVVVFRDVTHEREIDKAKTEFVSLASHQLRTPLSVVNWYAEMLLAGDLGSLNKKQKKYMKEVYRGSRRMVSLVNELLNVSRLELGTFMVRPEPINVVKLVESVTKEQKPRIRVKKIKFKEKYADDLPEFNADPKLLRMVFQNLLSNAVKYTPYKGSIAIEIGLSGDDILFKISDNGYGIPKTQQGKIFLRFFRADNIREIDPEGTGLGLYIAKSVVDYSGGKIWFESYTKDESPSADKQGTAFYVAMPLSGMKKKEGAKRLT